MPGLKGEIISRQLVRAATSVRSNYRAACRARSRAAFLNKIYTVLEEADETRDWLELVLECQLSSDRNRGAQLIHETDEILAMLFSSQRTAQKCPKGAS
jgi:four helix bundle protein